MAKDDFADFTDAPNVASVLTFGGRTGSRENFEALPLEVQDRVIAAASDYFKKTGKTLQVNSALRPREDQERLYNETVTAGRPGIGPTGMPVAKPGKSRHEGGFAIDIQQGKGDKDAVAILNQYGLRQTVKNDPVHFELAPQQVQPAPVAAPVAPAAAAAAPTPVAQPAEPTALRTAQAGLAGVVQGGLAGLGQYPAAGLVSLASRVAPQGGQPLSYQQALEQLRESQQSLQQEAPLAYGAGQVAGGAAALGKISAGASLAHTAGRAGLMGATSRYTEAPETTLGEAITQGGIEGGLTLGVGGVGTAAAKGVGAALGKGGEISFRNYVKGLVESGTEGGQRTLKNIFGPLYKEAKTIAKAEKPVMPTGRAGEVLPKYQKELSAWEKRNEGLTDIQTFASRFAENPKLIQKYADRTDVPQKVKTNYQKVADKLPARLGAAATGASFARYTQSSLAQSPLLGAGVLGALAGTFSGQDPIQSALGGGLTGAAVGFAVPALSRRVYTSPTARKVISGAGKTTQITAPQIPRAVEQVMAAQDPFADFPDAE